MSEPTAEAVASWPCRFGGTQYGICTAHSRDFQQCFDEAVAYIGTLKAMIVDHDAFAKDRERRLEDAIRQHLSRLDDYLILTAEDDDDETTAFQRLTEQLLPRWADELRARLHAGAKGDEGK